MNFLRAHDNRDDRTTFNQLLAKLSPRNRLAFLAWCCRQSWIGNGPGRVPPRITRATYERMLVAEREGGADEKLTIEVLMDTWALCLQHNLNLSHVLKSLERAVRRPARLHRYCFTGPDALPVAAGSVQAVILR